MDTGFLEVLHDGANQHFFAIRGGVDINLRSVAKVFVDQERLVGSEVGFSQIAVKLLLIGEDLHAPTAKNIRRANEHRKPDFFHSGPKVVGGCAGGTSWHAEVVAACEGLEALTVAGFVNRIAARITIGQPLKEQSIPRRTSGQVCVKAPVFPFIKLRGLDPAPGPEMKSTGEVYGSDERADLAYLKARLATEVPVATEGGAYLTVRDEDKENLVPVAQELVNIGFTLYATAGTADALRRHDVPVTTVYRIAEGQHPDALDLMRQGKVSFIVNVPTVSGGAVRDGNMMRRLAVELNIPFVTTMRGASMEVAAMRAHIEEDLQPRKLTVHY